MSSVNAFQPRGATYVVSTDTVQIKTNDNVQAISYRIRNLTGGTAYIAWAPANPLGAAVTIGSVSAPSAGSPVANTLGLYANSVEVFTLPPNVWLKSSDANAFEVTPGEGL